MYTNDVELWPDEKLLELIQADDRAAFEQVYNKYWSKLYLSAYNILRDRQASEDIVQEVLVSLWMKRSSLAIKSLNAFLYCAVRYQVLNAIRSGKARQHVLSEAGKLSVENEGESALCEKDINCLLEQGIAELPGKCRQIYLLSRKEHLTTREIAMQLGIASKTVENQLTIALRRLRVTLGHFLLWTAVFLSGW
ncbi:RNA polymerase sigma-70 factor [Pontibacter sp. 172403-2]|uniref:RNA polymerase sigma-70 factor n=1 Tax=Pontibacter rufus TaxID=2791028 RepID=UPI0018AF8232|nr:RNA polymerase sigma-70 factor [Pontibacter sp. 172403-2]MBF9252689.1 RNA polymerase sigma-70 factor [Pontibacter sp. 172403-2]